MMIGQELMAIARALQEIAAALRELNRTLLVRG